MNLYTAKKKELVGLRVQFVKMGKIGEGTVKRVASKGRLAILQDCGKQILYRKKEDLTFKELMKDGLYK